MRTSNSTPVALHIVWWIVTQNYTKEYCTSISINLSSNLPLQVVGKFIKEVHTFNLYFFASHRKHYSLTKTMRKWKTQLISCNKAYMYILTWCTSRMVNLINTCAPSRKKLAYRKDTKNKLNVKKCIFFWTIVKLARVTEECFPKAAMNAVLLSKH